MTDNFDEVWRRQRELAALVTQTEDRVWDAPSGEHAVAWLRVTHYWPSARSWQRGQTLALPKRVLFRGHADARWAPVSTLGRLSGDAALREARRTRLASGVIQAELEILWSGEWAQYWPPYGTRSGLAAAQHYGFATNLLDWTTNPSTAVHFATCSATSKHSRQAAVLVLDIEDAAKLGLEVVLPPAIVYRLYLQRGVFVDLEAAHPAALQSKVDMVRFPAQPRCPAFATTDGRDQIALDLLPDEPWFERLHQWSTAKADDLSLASDPMLANIAFTSRHGHHPALAQLQGILLPSIPHGQVSMMMGVINEIAGRWLEDRYFYEPRILDVLSKHNPSLIEWLEEIVGLPRLPVG